MNPILHLTPRFLFGSGLLSAALLLTGCDSSRGRDLMTQQQRAAHTAAQALAPPRQAKMMGRDGLGHVEMVDDFTTQARNSAGRRAARKTQARVQADNFNQNNLLKE